MTTKYLILLQKVIKTPHIGFERATESQRTQINARQVELIFGLFGLLSSKHRHIGSVRGVKNQIMINIYKIFRLLKQYQHFCGVLRPKSA